MSYRIWYFIAAVSGVAAVMFGAYGQHETRGGHSFDIANTYHLAHTAALFGIAILLSATQGRRNTFASLLTQLGGLAFLLGIGMFVGGVYYQTIFTGSKAPYLMIPAGGTSFAVGWGLLALSSFGYREGSK